MNVVEAKNYTKFIFKLSLIISGCIASAIYLLRHHLAAFYTDITTVKDLAAFVLIFTAISHFFDFNYVM